MQTNRETYGEKEKDMKTTGEIIKRDKQQCGEREDYRQAREV